MKIPDTVLNSKIKKVRVELPHYNFSHSSSEESTHFVGRKQIKEKLKKLVEATDGETGVYLVTGNRGVGKTSLVNMVISETSLQDNSIFAKNLKFLLILLVAVAGVQFCLQKFLQEFLNELLQKFPQFEMYFLIVLILFLSFCSFLLCCFNGYRYKISKQKNILWKIAKEIYSCIISGIQEFFTLINPNNPYKSSQYVLKIILVVSVTQYFYIIYSIVPIIAFIIYSAIVLPLHGIDTWKEYSHEYKKDGLLKIFKIPLIPFWKYIKNHRRLYLRINFGHELKDEKDILRLIARTLSTEYNEYLRSFGRMLPWRVMALGGLLLFAYMFSTITEDRRFYKLIKESPLYQASSQIFLKDSILNEKVNESRLERAFPDSLKDSWSFYKVKNRVTIKDPIIEESKTFYVKENLNEERRLKRAFLDLSKDNSFFYKVKISLLILDDIVFEISKRVKKTPQVLLCNGEKIDFDKVFVTPVNYLFWLSFFLMYVLSVLLFRCRWIKHFFVTHRIIKQKLKRLNSDITHSTERESSINIRSEVSHIIPEFGARTKKSRGVADAREIEKELQDILDNMQRVPVFMCRPNVVIVFDELDKVEPDEVNSEKESPRTKASLFSVDATRERQREILNILSNMKYFLSTAKAKFIFIAGREMYDIYLADVSERSNYIGSIFSAVIYVPSFLTDHAETEHHDITLLTEEFVCQRLIPRGCTAKSKPRNLKRYRNYLKRYIYNDIKDKDREQKIQKIIAVLQQLIIYLAHISKGAPKKMTQLFESFIEVCEIDKNEKDKCIDKNENEKDLTVQRYHNSKFFLTFNYYSQFTLGIIAYLMTPIFSRLSEGNIKERSDKLMVSSLRFIDFLFKFHKHPFSWRHLDISPEMLEVNRSPALKSVAAELLNYLTQVHINRSNFSFSDYKFDDSTAGEISAMTKMDNVFSALFSFSLDETLPLKEYYQNLLEKTQKEYQQDKSFLVFIDAVSSLQVVLGDLHYYDDELEKAGVYYKNVVQTLSRLKSQNNNYRGNMGGAMTLEQHYLYVRNMIRLGMIYEKRKQYDFAYLTYGELCRWIVRKRDGGNTSQPRNFKDLTPDINDVLFNKMTYDGLRMLYLPFIAKLQILEKSFVGGITPNHLKQLEKEFTFLNRVIFSTNIIDNNDTKHLKAEYYSRLADILYYKNSDLKNKKNKNRKEDNNENGNESDDDSKDIKNYSCTACYYYHKALSILLDLDVKNTVTRLLYVSIERINDNYNMKFCTILARILSDWGNVFFSCDDKRWKDKKNKKNEYMCYICDVKDCNTHTSRYNLETILKKYIDYVEFESKEKNRRPLLDAFDLRYNFSKMEIAFAMYAISSKAYTKSNLYKRSAYQIFKMLSLFKYYKIYNDDYIKKLSQTAISSLWRANEEVNIFEIKKRKTVFEENKNDGNIPLRYTLVDSEIHRIWILVKELELESNKLKNKSTNESEKYYSQLKKYYDMYITSPYGIIYSVTTRIYQLRLKTAVNYEAYKIRPILKEDDCNQNKIIPNVDKTNKIDILAQLIAETIFCFNDIIRLSKTMGEETYLFNHSFMGSIHEKLTFWIRLYEKLKKLCKKKNKDGNTLLSLVDKYLEYYLGTNWKEQLSAYYENQQALSHYRKSLEIHSEGRAYHNMIDNMCYVKDDYNDRPTHFCIAVERHKILNGKIHKKIDRLEKFYKNSKLHIVDSYCEGVVGKKEP